MVVLFILTLFVIGYITLFGRNGTNDTTIRVQFAAIQEAIRTRSFEPLQHLWLNIVMFIPIGFLFPGIYPPRLNKYSIVFIVGLMCSCFIESMQMILTFGQPDVEDLLGNTIGALIGIFLYRRLLHSRGVKNDE